MFISKKIWQTIFILHYYILFLVYFVQTKQREYWRSAENLFTLPQTIMLLMTFSICYAFFLVKTSLFKRGGRQKRNLGIFVSDENNIMLSVRWQDICCLDLFASKTPCSFPPDVWTKKWRLKYQSRVSGSAQLESKNIKISVRVRHLRLFWQWLDNELCKPRGSSMLGQQGSDISFQEWEAPVAIITDFLLLGGRLIRCMCIRIITWQRKLGTKGNM